MTEKLADINDYSYFRYLNAKRARDAKWDEADHRFKRGWIIDKEQRPLVEKKENEE